MAEKKGPLGVIIQAFIVLAILATLGVSIAVLITTLNIQNNQSSAPAAPATNVPATAGTNAPVSSTVAPPTTKSNNNNNPGTPNAVNIPQAQPAKQGQTQYQSYQSVVQLLKQGLNLNADPCNDFYAYTCSALNGDMSFDVADRDNVNKMVAQMNNAAYVKTASTPVKQVVALYNKCRDASVNWDSIFDGSQVAQLVATMMAGDTSSSDRQNKTGGMPFPMYDQTSNVTAFPTSLQMAYLTSYPNGLWGINNLISAGVDTNWRDPQGQQGYSFLIDQPTTLLGATTYVKAWTQMRGNLIQSVVINMNKYANSQNVQLDQTTLLADATALVDFDYLLATTFSTDETTRRQNARSYNPMTISQLQQKYNNIFWHEYIPLAMLASSDAMQVTLGNPNYGYIVMEPDMLQKLNDALVVGNSYSITPNTLLNYVYYGIISANSGYLPPLPKTTSEHIEILALVKKHSPKDKKRRGVISPKDKRELGLTKDVDEIAAGCASDTTGQLPYANARVFIDNIYPTDQSRTDIRNNVAKVASSILIGMRSMVDQLDWMTSSTKKGAYGKIENLVKNIAYPDFITHDVQLTNYHQKLNLLDSDDYWTMITKVNNFNNYLNWQALAQGPADRQAFNGPPGIVNAWYQPEVNSITFPAGILRQPFYDPSWPAAVNFGGMGVIAGHELTHGFDDQGVQWDGVGALNGWMDAQSQSSFNDMANCVVNEYSQFCPLNQTVYGKAACVDGAQTQGENIADNGGIHAAFRAYKNYINLWGPDPLLPDPVLQEFTADQLFFLAFAQVWCQMPPTDRQLENQILLDPHSPSQYRVFGTIQNFPAFKDAFHCPVSAYAPEKHCNVWVSDISSSYGQPSPKANDINAAVQQQVKPTNDMDKYNAYQQAVNYYQYSTDFTADPCSDFWKYSCGNYKKKVSFHYADDANLVTMANQLTNPNYQFTIAASVALTKEKTFFDACIATTSDGNVQNQTLVQDNFLVNKVNNLKTQLGGADFTAVMGGKVTTRPTPTQMALALGYLSFQEGIDTYVTPMVDTNWIDNSVGYRFFVDQNSAEMSKTYYAPQAFPTVRTNYLNRVIGVFTTYCKEQGLNCSTASIKASANTLIDFEQNIAYNYSTDDTTRRQYQRSWNLMTVQQMTTSYPFVDWATYVNQLPNVAVPIVGAATYQIAVMEQGMTTKMSNDMTNTFDPDTIVNYLYMRLLLDNAQYLPSYKSVIRAFPLEAEKSANIGKNRRGRKLPRRRLADASTNGTQTQCIGMANDLMQFANGRVFIDNMYPTNQSRTDIRNSVGGLITNVINSFQGMLEQLEWMDADTKMNALAKTNQILTHKNIAFPDWITDNNQLDAYYNQLSFTADDDYFTMWDKLIKFNIDLQYNQLTKATTDRSDFLGQPGTVNAWYQPELDSITFPAGILVPPYFHPKWPASINYGGLGVVAGHELTHGFDDEGVQWGPTGNLAGWMTDTSKAGFDNMATCVVNEYSNFCPLNANQYTPNCVNGNQTQGENIADNGGIHAAFRAYRTHINLNGPDPLLADRVFSQFTHDQLFFLSFAQVWCEEYRGDNGMYTQLMVDPHSPSQYRVFGTIQNFPAFQTAFNCPANSAYTPNNHCKVWVPNYEA